MKIFNPSPIHIIRLTIIKKDCETFYINICDTNQNEVENYLKDLLDNQKLSIFLSGHRTRIDIRDCIGGENGKSKSISFRGLSTQEVNNLILKDIENEK